MDQRDTRLLTLAETARQLGVSTRTIQNWVKRGAIAPVTVAGRPRIRASDLDLLRQGRLVGSQGEASPVAATSRAS